MKNVTNLIKTLALCLTLVMMAGIMQAAVKTAIKTGIWSSKTTWGNAANETIPAPGDEIVISADVILTIDQDASISKLTIGTDKNNGGAATLKFNSNISLTITGDLIVGVSRNAIPGNIDMSLGGNLKIGGAVTMIQAGTWTSGSGTVDYNGTANQALPTTWMTSYNNLTLSGIGAKTLGGNITVGGTFNNSSSIIAGSTILTISGPFTNSGSLTPGTGTVIYNGSSAQDIAAFTYNNLTLSGAGVKTLKGNTTVGGTFNNSSSITAGSNTLTISGPFTNSGSLTQGTSTVVYNGGSSQDIAAFTYNNLTLSGAGGKTLGGNVTVTGELTKTASLSLGANALTLSGTYTESGAFTAGTGTVIYNGTNQTIIAWPYYNLTISGTGTKTLAAATTVSNNFTINTNAILNTSTNALTLNGGFTNNGILQIGSTLTKTAALTTVSGTVEYNGVAQTVADLTFNNLTLSGSSQKTVTGVTVNGILSMEGTATVNAAPTFGTSATLQYNSSTSRTNGVEWLSDFTATGGVKLVNTGIITLDKSRTYSLPKLTITAGNLTIPAGSQVTVSGETAINVADGLTIESVSELSGGAGTGSFKTATATTNTTPGTITTIVKRYMSPRSWHMVSSSVLGQSISNFLTTNPYIPLNTVAGHTAERGMRGYNPDINQWTNFYTDGEEGDIETGKGFLVRVKGSETSTKEVTFKGTLLAGPLSASGLTPGMWNCIGNPYTSALKLNTAAADNFLDVNATNLDMNFGGIYIWHQSNEVLDDAQANGTYEPVTNASSLDEIQQGQAFMVKMADGKSLVNFTYAMQSHNTGLALKSTDGVWPAIKLMASVDSVASSTIIAFHEGMTPGLDPTYDAGLLKGGASLEVYTRLLEDNGIPFDIQALPADNYNNTIIPVGIDCNKGGMLSFSAELIHVPSACRPLLEDRLTGLITDLSNQTYTTNISANTAGTGRFYLHTSYSTTGAANRDKASLLSAWAVGNHEITINGKINNGAVASLYDLQGRLIVTRVLREGISDHISLPAVNRGIYLLQVRDSQTMQALKVTIGQ